MYKLFCGFMGKNPITPAIVDAKETRLKIFVRKIIPLVDYTRDPSNPTRYCYVLLLDSNNSLFCLGYDPRRCGGIPMRQHKCPVKIRDNCYDISVNKMDILLLTKNNKIYQSDLSLLNFRYGGSVPVKIKKMVNLSFIHIKLMCITEADTMLFYEPGWEWWFHHFIANNGCLCKIKEIFPISKQGNKIEHYMMLNTQKEAWHLEITYVTDKRGNSRTLRYIFLYSDVKKVISNTDHSLILIENNKGNTVLSVGYNKYGQLGMGNCMNILDLFAMKVVELKNIVNIEVGPCSSFFINHNGEVFACGLNNVGQLGINTKGRNILRPRKIKSLNGVTQIRAGLLQTFFIKGARIFSCGGGSGHLIKLVDCCYWCQNPKTEYDARGVKRVPAYSDVSVCVE